MTPSIYDQGRQLPWVRQEFSLIVFYLISHSACHFLFHVSVTHLWGPLTLQWQKDLVNCVLGQMELGG